MLPASPPARPRAARVATLATALAVALGAADLVAPRHLAAQNATTYTWTDAEATQRGRVARDLVPSDYRTPAPPLARFNTGQAFRYAAFRVTNPFATAMPLAVRVTPFENENFFVLYDGSFDPAEVLARHIGDIGYADDRPTATFSATVAGGSDAVLVASRTQNVNTPAAGAFTFTPAWILSDGPTSFSYTWRGDEPTQVGRIGRVGGPSVWNVPQPPPTTFAGVYAYTTFAFLNPFGTDAIFRVGSLTSGASNFLSVYDGAYDPRDFTTNHLGNAGLAGIGGGAVDLTVRVPGDGIAVLVLNRTVQGAPAGAVDLTLSFTPIPEPTTVALVGTGLAALLVGGARRRRRG